MTNFSIDNLSHPNLHSFHRPWRIVEFLYNVICRWYIMEICYFCRKTKYKSSSNNLNVCFLSQKCFLTSCFETQYTKLWKMSLWPYLLWPFYTVWKTKDGNWKNSRFRWANIALLSTYITHSATPVNMYCTLTFPTQAVNQESLRITLCFRQIFLHKKVLQGITLLHFGAFLLYFFGLFCLFPMAAQKKQILWAG